MKGFFKGWLWRRRQEPNSTGVRNHRRVLCICLFLTGKPEMHLKRREIENMNEHEGITNVLPKRQEMM